jgi:hypothetical protein
LIGHEALQQHQGDAVARLVLVFERAGQRRDIRKGDFGEKPAHLQLRADAGLQAAIAFHQQPLADSEGGVAAVQRQPLDRQRFRSIAGQFGERRGDGEFQPAPSQGIRAPRAISLTKVWQNSSSAKAPYSRPVRALNLTLASA